MSQESQPVPKMLHISDFQEVIKQQEEMYFTKTLEVR